MFSPLLLWHVMGWALWLLQRNRRREREQVNYLGFTRSDGDIFILKLQNSEHLGVTEIYHSQFPPQSQKNSRTSTDVSVLIIF